MRVYLDCNSTTPLDPRVLEVMLPFFSENFGNPSSAHSCGAVAARAIAVARKQVADLVRAEPDDVVFCSSATEAINAVIGSVDAGVILTTEVEHSATLRAVERARARGVLETRLKVDASGQIDLSDLENLLVEQPPSLVSVIWANNETGVILPIQEISALCNSHSVPLHVDAVQAAGKLPVDLDLISIDYLTISAHKIFGPKGMAALVAKNKYSIRPMIVGGHQEMGRRAGTENVPGIVGFGEAARIALGEREDRQRNSGFLRDYFEEEVVRRITRTSINGARSPRLRNTSSISFDGVDGDDLSAALDAYGIFVSTGSACNADATEPSHVIKAMTGSYSAARGTIRFGFSHLTTRPEVDYTLSTLVAIVNQLRG